MTVTIAVIIVAAHEKQLLRNLNIPGKKKRTGALGILITVRILDRNLQIKRFMNAKIILQQIRLKTPNSPIKFIDDQYGISQKQ